MGSASGSEPESIVDLYERDSGHHLLVKDGRPLPASAVCGVGPIGQLAPRVHSALHGHRPAALDGSLDLGPGDGLPVVRGLRVGVHAVRNSHLGTNRYPQLL